MSVDRDDCPVGAPSRCPVERRVDDPRWAEIAGRMDGFDEALRTNTAITREIKTNTDEIVAFFQSGKGFFRTMGAIGAFAKWVGKIATAGVVLWALFKYGVLEAIRDINGNVKR